MIPYASLPVRSPRIPRMLSPIAALFPIAAIAALACAPVQASAQVTFAGAQTTVSNLGGYGIAIDSSGNLYIADGEDVYKLTRTGTGYTQTTVAQGLGDAVAVAVDSSGNVYIADSDDDLVLKETPSGDSYTQSVIVDSSSGLISPNGVAVDGGGKIFVLDMGAGELFQAVHSAGSWSLVLVATSPLNDPTGVATDASGDLYIADSNNARVLKETPAGGGTYTETGVANSSNGLTGPQSVAVDLSGNVYIGDEAGSIFKATKSGATYTTAALQFVGLEVPVAVAVDKSGDVFVSDIEHGRDVELGYESVNIGAQAVGSTGSPLALNFSIAAGTVVGKIRILTTGIANLDFADGGSSTCVAQRYLSAANCTVSVKFTPAAAGLRLGAVVFYRGAGTVEASVPVYGVGTGPQIAWTPATQANVATGLSAPEGLAIDAGGNVYVATPNNDAPASLFEYSPNGSGGWTKSATISTTLNNPPSLAVDGAGNVFVANYSGGSSEYSLVNGAWTRSAAVTSEDGDYGLAVDGAGNVYISNQSSDNVVEYSLVNGTWTQSATVATGLGAPFGIAVDSSGNVYIVDNGNADVLEYSFVAGAWQKTATIASGLNYPFQVAVDAAGSVYVTNGTSVEQYSLVGSAWTHVASIGAGLAVPEGVALDGSGNVYISDWSTGKVVQVNRSTPPGLSFANTSVGSTSTDSPKAATVENIGNEALTFTGLSYPTDFPEAGSGVDPCAGTTSLSPTTTCSLNIDFTPQSGGALAEYVALTDNALNGTGTQQYIPVSGTAKGGSDHLVLSVPGDPGPPYRVPFYTAFTFVITAYDAQNNVDTNYNGTLTFTSSDPDYIVFLPFTLTNGVGTGTGVLKAAGIDTITATDVTNSAITGTGYFTVQPGGVTYFGASAPAQAYLGNPISFTVTAYDLILNIATSYGGTVTFTSSDPLAILPGSTAIVNGTGTLTATFETAGLQTITATDATNSLGATSNQVNVTIPNLVVTNVADDAGSASNCTIQTTPGTGTDASCSLRDALLFAAGEGSGSITFDSTRFAAPTTITLGSAGTLEIPPNTSITGPTSGTGYGLFNLVTVDGASTYQIFNSTGTVNVTGLTIADGNNPTGGAAIRQGAGTLTVNNCIFQTNYASFGDTSNGFGGAIRSDGSLVVMNSTFTENDAGAQGGAIYQSANSLTIVNSTFVGNSSNEAGAVYFSGATAAIAESTISQNSAPTAGAVEAAAGTLTLTNNMVAANTFLSGGAIDNGATTNANYNVYFSNPGGGGPEVDCFNCTSNTNFVEAAVAPITTLGTYGGPTQTYLPQPLGGAICAGSAALVPSGTTTDQRGLPFDPLCPSGAVDAGSVQSNYALSFATQPPANVTPATVFSPAPVVELTESGALASTVSGTVTITGSDWPIGGTTSVSLSSGTATFSNLTAADLTTGETLIAAIALNTTLTPPVSATTASDGIHVTRNDQTIGFTPIAFNQNVQTSIPLSATATSSLTVSFTSLTPATCTVSGTNASLNAYGFCTIEASQAGNIEIAPAPNVEQTIFIHHASQTISFPAIAFNQNAASTLPLEATATSGLAVTFASLTPATCTVSGATLNLNDYGFCTIQTSQNGNSVYGEAAHVEQTTFIHHLNQTISFGAITSQTVGSPLTLSATASSGLTVGFTSLTPSVCTVSGATATFLKAGTCTIEAAQSGNGVYGVAPAVKQSFKVNP